MPMKAIFPPGSGKTLAPYSPGAMADGVVYVAGTLALDKDANVVHVGDAAKQTEFAVGSATPISSIRGASASKIWLVDDSGVFQWTGASWALQTTAGSSNSRLSVTNDHAVWLTNYSGVSFFNGTTWTSVSTSSSSWVTAAWGSAANNAWAFDQYRIYHFNGMSWGTTW